MSRDLGRVVLELDAAQMRQLLDELGQRLKARGVKICCRQAADPWCRWAASASAMDLYLAGAFSIVAVAVAAWLGTCS